MSVIKRIKTIKKANEFLDRMKSLGHLYEEGFVRNKVNQTLENYNGLNGHRRTIVALAAIYLSYKELRKSSKEWVKVKCLGCKEGGSYHDIGSLPYLKDYFGPSVVAIRNVCKKLKKYLTHNGF